MDRETDPRSKPSYNLNSTNSAASRSSVYCEALTRLREVLPDSLWPEVRPALSEDVSFGKAELQHGRVLVGLVYREEDQGQDDAEERALWAHLWKIDCRGSAVLSFYYNTKEELRIGEPEFLNVNFQKWCHMLATDQSPLGCSGGKWEQRLKTVVKIALLGSGYLNPKDYTFPDLPTIISVISKHKPTHQSRSPSLRNPNGKRPSDRDDLDEFVEQMVEPNSDDDYLDGDNDDELLVNPNSAARAISTNRSGIKPFHIQVLQEAFPPTVWPRVEACNHNLEEFSPGKVYLGCLPTAGSSSDSSQEVWARVKGKASAKRTGHISYVWNNGRTAKFTYGNLARKMVFAKPFQYLGDPQAREKKNTQDELQETRNTWRASIAFCVRAALVHAQMIDGSRLPIRINPARIVEIIGQNRARFDNRAARHAALETSDHTNDASGNGFIPTPSSSPIADDKSKKRRLDSDHDISNAVGDGMPSATTPAPRRFSIASPVSLQYGLHHLSNCRSDISIYTVPPKGS
jgi:hypothetical protein